MKTEELIEIILKTHVISYIDKGKHGYMVAIIETNSFMKNKDYHQDHFTGKTVIEALGEAVKWINSGS